MRRGAPHRVKGLSRGVALSRRTALKSDTALKPGTKGLHQKQPLKRTTGLRSTGQPAKPAPGKAPTPSRSTGPSETVRLLVLARCSGWCEWPGCAAPAAELHHRLNRKQGGRHGEAHERLNGAAWLLAACRRHHRRVTSPVGEVRQEAEQWGWLLREHQDAPTTPVRTRHRAELVLLGNDGSWIPAVPPAPPAR